jgi:hydrogenase/urease accessory protein HupE
MAVAGLRTGDPAMVRNGTWQGLAGLGIFAVGLVFFEGILGISGRRLPLPDWSLAALVILVGIALVVRAAVTRQGSPD